MVLRSKSRRLFSQFVMAVASRRISIFNGGQDSTTASKTNTFPSWNAYMRVFQVYFKTEKLQKEKFMLGFFENFDSVIENQNGADVHLKFSEFLDTNHRRFVVNSAST